MDACIATLPHAAFVPPSFSQARLDKSTRSAPLLVTPQADTSSLMTKASPAHEPATPKSATFPVSGGMSDVEMSRAFVTPPQASRVLPIMETSDVRTVVNPLRLSTGSSQALGSLAMSKPLGPFLNSPKIPMTPPLTPPYPHTIPLRPGPLSSPCPLPPAPKATPATISGRALADHSLHPLFASTYSLCEELGAGGFGFVVRAERNHDNLSVAVKFIERAKIPSHGWVKSRSWGETPGLTQAPGPKLVPMEAFVLRSVRHDGVVAFIDLFEDQKYFYLVSCLQLLHGGSSC